MFIARRWEQYGCGKRAEIERDSGFRCDPTGPALTQAMLDACAGWRETPVQQTATFARSALLCHDERPEFAMGLQELSSIVV